MSYVVQGGLLTNARFVPSPNCDERPAGTPIDLLVIHSISLPPACYGGSEIEEFFCNRLDTSAHPFFAEIAGVKVSAHLLLRRSGEAIQFVNFEQRAWHAGESCFAGRSCCNDFSIGIELEGCDQDSFTSAQYAALVDVTLALQQAYPGIENANITGHEHIAPGRKTDPGPGFDWSHYRRLHAQALASKN